jgi:hypothetical protein
MFKSNDPQRFIEKSDKALGVFKKTMAELDSVDGSIDEAVSQENANIEALAAALKKAEESKEYLNRVKQINTNRLNKLSKWFDDIDAAI